jgi:hypothetical protein
VSLAASCLQLDRLLLRAFGRRESLLRHRQIEGILDVFPKFLHRLALAEDARNFSQAADIEIAVSSKLERELSAHLVTFIRAETRRFSRL